MKWFVYNFLFFLVFPFLLPRFLFRMWRRGGYRRHFGQRFGLYAPQMRRRFRTMRSPVWIHGVSVGEVGVALQLIKALRQEDPSLSFVLSTSTSTGYRQASAVFEHGDAAIYVPVDFPLFVNRALAAVRPRALVLAESELWPNLIRSAGGRGIPVMLVNARISDRSFPGYMRLRPWFSSLLKTFAYIHAQSALDRERLLAMGAVKDKVLVRGSFKYDAPAPDAGAVSRARDLLRRLWPETPAPLLLMGGSTWPGEEEIMLSILAGNLANKRSIRLILAPRHAERSDRLAGRIKELGFTVARLSQFAGACAPQPAGARTVLLLDTTGDLPAFYACADLVFVGKSLCARGGQNMIEPVAAGKPTLVGPHTGNFRSVMADLLEAGAIRQVAGAEELVSAGNALIQDVSARAGLQRRAVGAIQQRRGVTRQCARQILELLDVAPD